MGRAYSMDLRERVVAVYRAGGRTMQQVADELEVGVATVNRLLRRTREQGSPVAFPPGRGPKPLIGDAEWQLIEALLREAPDMTMQEVAWALDERHGLKVSRSTVQKAVQTRNWTRKKKPSEPKNKTRTAFRGSEQASRSGSNG